jgi:putative membrane protein
MTTRGRLTRAAAVAGALALAGGAHAQGRTPWPTTPPPQDPPQTTPPATPPATQPPTATPPVTPPAAPPTTGQPPAGQPVDAQAKATIDDIHARNVSAVHYAGVAAQKATNPTLKQFASKTAADASRLDQELQAIAAERGIQLHSDGAIASGAQFKAGLQQLQALNGAEFDRAYAEAAVADRTKQVEDLKALRDATPGKDARLKSWIDQAENVMEEQRNQARVALKDVTTQQRQGRTPAK